MNDLIDGLLDELRWIVGNGIIDSRWEILLRSFHDCFHPRCGGESIRAGALKDQHRRRRIAVKVSVDGIIQRTEFYPSNVTDANVTAVVGPDHDIAELFGIGETSESLDRELERSR